MTFIHTRRCVAVVQEQNDHDLQMMNGEKERKEKKSKINNQQNQRDSAQTREESEFLALCRKPA